MEVILGAIAIWSAFFIFGFIRRAISAKIWRGWTLKKSALAALPLALIVVIELISPSIKLTGYIPPPKPVELQWQTQKSTWTDVPLTWADVDHHLFGTAPDGYLPKEMLQAQLKQHRLEVIKKYEAPFSGGMGYLSNSRKREINRRKLHLAALNTVIENLDALYADGPVTPQEFRIWQAKIVEDIAIIEHTRAKNLFRVANQNWEIAGRATPDNDEVRQAKAMLKNNYYHTQKIFQTALRDLEQVRAQQATLAQRAKFARPSQTFAPPPWPLETAAESSSARTVDLLGQTLKGPKATTGPREWAARIFKAFDNNTRMPAHVPSGIRCYVSITGQAGALQKSEICEIHTPILINFDLTMEYCASNEDVSCVERWVFPDLTILLRDNDVTFLAPRPTAPAWRPASRWEITVNGETKPLEKTATFTLAADRLFYLPDYILRQLPNDTAGEIRIWKDFETARFLRNEASLRKDLGFHTAHAFAGHTVTTPQLSYKIARILGGAGQNAELWKYYSHNDYLNLMNARYLGVSFEGSRCSDDKGNSSSYLRPVSRRLSHLAPRVKSWILQPTLPSERCRRATTLTVLYEGIWPTDPSSVFTDNY